MAIIDSSLWAFSIPALYILLNTLCADSRFKIMQRKIVVIESKYFEKIPL